MAAPAAAESPFKGGLNYTAVRRAPDTPAPEQKRSSFIKQKTIEQPEDETEAEETPADKVWKKYKALAAGQAGEEEEETPETKPRKEDSSNSSQTTQASAKPERTMPAPTGFAAIIEKYQTNREQRSQIRTIRAPKPPPPQDPDEAEE